MRSDSQRPEAIDISSDTENKKRAESDEEIEILSQHMKSIDE